MIRLYQSLFSPSSPPPPHTRTLGSDLVDWLHSNVEGFIDRRHARKYAALMLKHGFVRHTVNKITFSEQCYYIFGDFRKAAQSLPSGNGYVNSYSSVVIKEVMCYRSALWA